MSIAALLVASAVAVPPNGVVENHGHAYQNTQPARRYYTRRSVDQARGKAWMSYVDELDMLWADYRAAGSTPEAFEQYLTRAAAAKRCYVYQDPYHIAQIWRVREVDSWNYRDCSNGQCGSTASQECESCKTPAPAIEDEIRPTHRRRHHWSKPVQPTVSPSDVIKHDAPPAVEAAPVQDAAPPVPHGHDHGHSHEHNLEAKDLFDAG